MDKVRLALVGFGKWGRNYVQAARDAGNAEVTQIVKHCADDDAIDWDSIDAVVYAGHPSETTKWAAICGGNGWPLLIEKPASITLAGAQYIKDASLGGRIFLVGHQHLFAEAFDDLRDLDPQKPLRAVWCGPGPQRDYSALWDYGPHAVASILATRGRDPIHVTGYKSHLGYTIRMVFDDGIADRAFVSADWPDKVAQLRETAHGWELPLYDGYASAGEPPLTRQVRAFADAVRNGGTDDWRFGGQWATRVASVLDRAERTAHPSV